MAARWPARSTIRLAARAGRPFCDAGDDAERAIDDIRHFQQNESFRLLLKDIAGLLPLEILSDHLSALADAVVEVTLAHLLRMAKLPDNARLAVIAYMAAGAARSWLRQ